MTIDHSHYLDYVTREIERIVRLRCGMDWEVIRLSDILRAARGVVDGLAVNESGEFLSLYVDTQTEHWQKTNVKHWGIWDLENDDIRDQSPILRINLYHFFQYTDEASPVGR